MNGDGSGGGQSGSGRRTWGSMHGMSMEMKSIRRTVTRGPGRLTGSREERKWEQNQSDHLEIPESIAKASDKDLVDDVRRFAAKDLQLADDQVENFVRAARVAKDSRVYERVARGDEKYRNRHLVVTLDDSEKEALVKERDRLFSESGIVIVSISVAIAAFLQGHVQSSVNGSASFPAELGITDAHGEFCIQSEGKEQYMELPQWQIGALNAAPFLSSALIGVWISMPVNDRLGRRGAMMVAAVLVFVTSLLSGLVVFFEPEKRWKALLGIRIASGLGMGIKAVSTPILASETAIRFYRGSFVLGWQLWVAFGIMTGFLVNLIFVAALDAKDSKTALALIMGSPVVPSIVLLCILVFCPESPRYYMRKGSPKYDPKKAFEILRKLRACELLAMKDMYILHKTVEEEYANLGWDTPSHKQASGQGEKRALGFFSQLKDLFTERRLRNALISSGTVNLAQPLSGINFMAIFSGPFFTEIFSGTSGGSCSWDVLLRVMGLSLGFGAVNFLFGLPAFKTIDSLGRRKWLIVTLPLMSAFMILAGLSFPLPFEGHKFDEDNKLLVQLSTRLVVMYLYFHAATYSPGMGPIPFTLASESFPLSHREIGCAFSVAICYGVMGILCLLYSFFLWDLGPANCMFLFACLCAVAWVLVFLFVEETKEMSLESLDIIFSVPKRQFLKHQVFEYLPWLVRRYLLRERPEPERPVLRSLEERPEMFVEPEEDHEGGMYSDHEDRDQDSISIGTADGSSIR